MASYRTTWGAADGVRKVSLEKRYVFGCNLTWLHLKARQGRCFYVKPNVHGLIDQSFVDENQSLELLPEPINS